MIDMSGQSSLSVALACGYDEDVRRAENELSRLERRQQDHPSDVQCRVSLLYRMYYRAMLTGRIPELEKVEAGILQAIGDFGAREDLVFTCAQRCAFTRAVGF